MSSAPKVSVCMITHNHAPFVRQAVDSALAQEATFDFEIVVGEDCSTDNTKEIIRHLSENSSKSIRLIDRELNVGMMANFIGAYAACRGEYIAFLEGDDYWTDPTKLSRQVELMDARPEFSMCFHQSEKVDHSGRSLKSFHPVSAPPVLGIQDVVTSNPIQTNSILLRRAMLPELPEFLGNLKLGDWPMCILLAMKGPIAYVDRPMAAYRIHPGSAWSSKSVTFHRLACAQMYIALAAAYPELEPAICDALVREVNTIESSLSYKTGFILTAPIRWLWDSKFRH